jgi:SAM-dependent methyltransferase
VTVHEQARHGFQRGAAAYERGRPGYPRTAIEWLERELRLGPGRTVVDVAAGTGKLTRELIASGATVIAVEPVEGMRAVLEQAVPQARALEGTAEALPFEAQSVDAIVVAQAFHWFDAPAALAEFHRVLRPEGPFALIWNRRQFDQPIHRAIDEIIEPHRGDTPSHSRGAWRQPLASTELFAPVAEVERPNDQLVDRDGLVDRVTSISFVANLPPAEHELVAARIRDLAAGAAQPIRLGYSTEAYVYERR